MPVACAVDLGCCVLLLVLPQVLLRVPCPPLLRDARLVATGPAQHSRAPADYAETLDRAGDLQVFSLTLSQLSYRGCCVSG